MAEDDSFWAFAGRLYGADDVKPALLWLQDERQLDIPLLLFALWAGHCGRRFQRHEMAGCIDLATTLSAELVQPVRAARRRLKARFPAATGLYRQLLDCELACEKLLMERLEAALPLGDTKEKESGRAGVAGDNTRLYLEMAGIAADDVAREKLAAVYRRFSQLFG